MSPSNPSVAESESRSEDHPAALCGWDGVLLEASPSFLRQFGWSHLPANTALLDLVEDTSRAELERIWQQALSGRSALAVSVGLRHFKHAPSSGPVRLLLHSTSRPGAESRLFQVELTRDDGQRDLLLALELAQDRFSRIFETTSDLVLIIAGDDEILGSNPAFEEFTGVAMEAFLAGEKGWPDIVHADDLPGLFAAFAGARAEPGKHVCQCRVRGMEEYWWHEFSLHPIAQAAGAPGLFCIMRDVHRLKLAEQSLRMQARALRDRQRDSQRRMDRMKALATAVAGVRGGRREFIEALRDGLAAFFPGLAVLVEVPPDAPPHAEPPAGVFLDATLLRLLFETGSPVIWTHPDEAPEGLDIPCDALLGVPVFAAAGAPAGQICLASDQPREFSPVDTDTLVHAAQLLASHISQWRRQDEEDRRGRQAMQGRKLESLGRLAGGLAHDFNNLVSIILNYALYAAKNLEPGTPAHADLQVVRQAAEQAADLTRKLMQFARYKPVELVPLDAGALVREVADLIRHGVRRDIEIRLEIAGDLPMVLGDATRLKQVVMNLCLNAAQSIGEAPGEIRVNVAPAADPAALFRKAGRPAGPAGAVEIEVRDSGPGIPAQLLPVIFDEFISTRREGLGLGLSIVRGILHEHGGGVQAESPPGQGAVFRCWIPARPAG